MRKLTFFLIVLSVLTAVISCGDRFQKDEPIKYVEVVITVGLDSSSVDTKTIMEDQDTLGGKMFWEVGDTLRLYNAIIQKGVCSKPLTSSDLTSDKRSANFTFLVPEGQAGYISILPNYLYYGFNAITMKTGVYGVPGTIQLAAAKTYRSDRSFDTGENVMFGYLSVGETTCVMKNIFAILKVTVDLQQDRDIEYVQLKSNGAAGTQNLAGKFDITGIETGTPTLTYQTGSGGGSMIIDQRVPQNVKMTRTGTFYFLIPPGSLSNGFDVMAYTRDGYYGGKRITLKKDQPFARSTITKMSLSIKEKPNPGPLYEKTANCYIIPSAADQYTFPAQYKGNGYQGNGSDISAGSNSLGDAGKYAEIIWQTRCNGETLAATDVLCSATFFRDEYGYGFITVRTTGVTGNALVALKDANGQILWSWHLWITDEGSAIENGVWLTNQNNPDVQVAKIMDRNLGALYSVPSAGPQFHGLAYQYGRKDPYMGSRYTKTDQSTALNYASFASIYPATAIYCVENDMTFNILKSVRNPYERSLLSTGTWCTELVSWGNLNGDLTAASPKTLYDPCPVGWRVVEEKNIVATLGYGPDKKVARPLGESLKSGDGYAFKLYNNGTPIYFPAGGFSETTMAVTEVGSVVSLWGSTFFTVAQQSSVSMAYYLHVTLKGIGTTTDAYTSEFKPGNMRMTMPLRCQKWEEPSIE